MLINRKFGNYLLVCRLAVGGQSQVFLALKRGPGDFSRPLVIKALPTECRQDPKFVELFYQEAFLSARFCHPNVVTVHDVRVIRGEYCMIMDFMSGQTVADVAQRGWQRDSPPSIAQAIQIVADACDGLEYTHHFRDLDERAYSVVHRDVSPQNLMVTYQGVTKVFDFGIAKVQERDGRPGTCAGGKYAYMSPEQCRDEVVDSRSDIFSLGIILYELAVGKRLFRRDARADIVAAVTDEPIEPPTEVRPDFPEELEAIVLKALHRDPDQRYQSAGRMRADLLEVLSVNSESSVRDELGGYVADLFARERLEIAQTVRRASRECRPDPIGDIPLEAIGRGDDDPDDPDDPVEPAPTTTTPGAEASATEPVAIPTTEPRQDSGLGARMAPPANGVDPADMASAHKKNRKLADEVRRLNRRQNVFIALLCVVAIAAAALALSNYSSQQAQNERIEIGSP